MHHVHTASFLYIIPVTPYATIFRISGGSLIVFTRLTTFVLWGFQSDL